MKTITKKLANVNSSKRKLKSISPKRNKVIEEWLIIPEV